MNVANKLLSYGMVQLSTSLTTEKPNNVKYMYGFILWIALPLIGLIPAFFVEEDLRRLNMKNVDKSVYLGDKELMRKTKRERDTIMLTHKMIANSKVLEMLDGQQQQQEVSRPKTVLPSINENESLIQDDEVSSQNTINRSVSDVVGSASKKGNFLAKIN